MIDSRSVDDLVSVVIPMYNAAPWIGEALASVAAQSRPVYECLVVDDGSTDHGPSIVSAFTMSSPCPVRLISAEHGGVSAARNVGIEASTGHFIAFLDADDVWAPDKIERQLTVMRQSDVVMCTTGYAMFDTHSRRVSGVVAARNPDRVIRRWLAMEGNGLLISSTAVVRRSSLQQAREFDTRVSICADLEFTLRMHSVGTVLVERRVLVGYRIHEAQAHRRLESLAVEMARMYDIISFDEFSGSFEKRCRANLDTHVGYSLLAHGEGGRGALRLLKALRSSPQRLLSLPAHALARRVSRRWRALTRPATWPVAVGSPRCG